jgi:Putative zinc-finger
MTLERKTTALEFETMLRRHLRRGGAPVSACAGFDPDRASAYLEGGLGGNTRGRYEAHLAGCPACRRHIIELSRLSQLALQPQAMPIVPARRSRWRSSLAESIDYWVDPSSWRLNWPVAGTVLAGCAILAFAMIAWPSRRGTLTSNQMSIAISKPGLNSGAAVPAPSPTQQVEDAEFKDGITANARRMEAHSLPPAPPVVEYSGVAQASAPTQATIPAPVIPAPRIMDSPNPVPSDAAPMRAVEQTERLSGAIEELGKIARNYREVRDKQDARPVGELEPPLPPPTLERKRVSQVARAEGSPATKPITFGQGSEVIAQNRNQNRNKMRGDRFQASMVMPRMTPNPEDNPMQSGRLRDSEIPKAKDEKISLPNQKTSIISASLSYIVDYMKSYWPWHRPNYIERSLVIGRDAKSDGDNADEENDENNKNSAVRKDNKAFSSNIDLNKSKDLIRHFRGKTFRYVRGVWIDDQYDAEISAWRLTWLRRGSESYNRVLAEEPQLKEFFDFGPIIIVWQDKIYRVTGK